jgi:hypothetical protein
MEQHNRENARERDRVCSGFVPIRGESVSGSNSARIARAESTSDTKKGLVQRWN